MKDDERHGGKADDRMRRRLGDALTGGRFTFVSAW
ncbi:hypothetical protein M2165_004475 [Variovorax sp. TBS-050B]|nr:hypothetical protein [Variovorax sp. TBS-050B]